MKFDLNSHNFLDQFFMMSGLKPHHTKASSFNSYESELISSTHYVVKLDLHIFNSGTKGTEQKQTWKEVRLVCLIVIKQSNKLVCLFRLSFSGVKFLPLFLIWMRNNFKNLHPTEIKNSINFQIYCYIQNRMKNIGAVK